MISIALSFIAGALVGVGVLVVVLVRAWQNDRQYKLSIEAIVSDLLVNPQRTEDARKAQEFLRKVMGSGPQ